MELRRAALAVLAIAEPGEKIAAVARLAVGATAVDPSAQLCEPAGLPGRPARPLLVPASRVPARSTATAAGRAALLHSIAHIEYNAINLALDAIWRFPGLPDRYYRDWLQVAREEARHHELLAKHLATLGVAYGDFDAHNGLWEMAERTRGDVLARMALVPRTLEARGLDATPGIRARFVASGDTAAADILDIILRDEIGHVAIGNRWYRHLCCVRGCDPHLTYEELASRFRAPRLRGPFNVEARRRAGFDEAEIDSLQNLIPRQRERGKD
jgi:uncharacterized ferritin-like protein (DUF455 family)